MTDKSKGDQTSAAGNATDQRTPHEENGPLTEQALEAILTSPSIDAAAAAAARNGKNVERDLSGYLNALMQQKNLKQADAINASGMDYYHAYDVIHGRNGKGVGRDNALRLCFGLQCTLRQAQRLLWHARASRLYARNRRDAIIIYCLEHHLSLAATDEALYQFGEDTLSDAR